jgi:hypothetical protein
MIELRHRDGFFEQEIRLEARPVALSDQDRVG